MDFTDDNLFTLNEYLKRTLSPDPSVRKSAEKFLESIELNQNYPLLLLHLVDKKDVEMTIRMSAAVAFKNFVKRNWSIEEDSEDRICAQDRETIRKLIVDMMLHSPESLQRQLCEAVSIIGKSDFPNRWPELMDQMIEKLNTMDFVIINGVLRTAHSLFKKYCFEFKSEALWTEIKYVLDKFAKPLTDLFVATMSLLQANLNNPEVLKVTYHSLVIMSKLFYSLNYQDLPEFFEDNMASWMENFHILLVTDVPLLATKDDEEAGLMEELKSEVCKNVELYASKYDEEFQPYIARFVEDVWKLLTSTGLETKFDALVSKALKFLVVVADRHQYRYLFENPTTLSSICEKVIIPNIQFRESDNELFEDNPEEYIRRDIEGSDIETRRRAACDLVRILSKSFEAEIMKIFGAYIQAMLEDYASNPTLKWHSKDSAIYLITSSASKGQTQKLGVTQSSDLVPLDQFALQHIENELARPNVDELPVLKADAIKFIMIFRSVLPRELVLKCVPEIIRHVRANSMVVHSYAACAIERIFALKLANGNELAPLASGLLVNLFEGLQRPGSEENEYIMKAIMRSFAVLEELLVPFLGEVIPKLTEKIALVARNPSRPNFNHYLFEALSLSIGTACKTNPDAVFSFEQALFPTFQGILQQDIQEFIPYVFQILALLLELQLSQDVPESYMALFPCLLAPILFERQGNIHPMNRLLQAFIAKGSQQIIKQDKVCGLLGVFQKLISSKANDHEGLLLMQTVIEFFPFAVLEQYMKQIFILLFQRLSMSRTPKYAKNLIIFFAHYVLRYGVNDLIKIVDQIQPQIFNMVVEKVIITDLQNVTDPIDRKVTAVGIVNILTECPIMLEAPYSNNYIKLLITLIQFLDMPAETRLQENGNFAEPEEGSFDYQAAYNQLTFAKKAKKDPLPAVQDPALYLLHGIKKVPQNKLMELLQHTPELGIPGSTECLKVFLKKAGIF